jgi:hypothetical protein
MEGSGCDVSRHYPVVSLEELRKTSKKLRIVGTVTRPRFEPGVSRIQPGSVPASASLLGQNLLVKLIVAQLLQKLTALYEARIFNTVITKAHLNTMEQSL